MDNFTLLAISPVDGRYQHKLSALQPIASEFGLIHYRVQTEINWLIFLIQKEITPFNVTDEELSTVSTIASEFSIEDAQRIKTIEQTTRHDVKAVEYFIQEKLKSHSGLEKLIPFIHFACTSEDINSTAYGLMLKDARQLVTQNLHQILDDIKKITDEHANLSMLARTHGQPASPTTLGKEFKNFAARLTSQIDGLKKIPIQAKFSGAVGNFNAHHIAYPDQDWPQLCATFIASLELHFNRYTTQIEPHDELASFWHQLIRINNILLDMCRDIWQYISLQYFQQKKAENEIGSSTMPHKINPIDFENAEGNIGIANAMAQHMASKLPISRLQRDLSDSTVLRNTGVVIAHSLLAYHSICQGLSRLEVNSDRIQQNLNQHWEVLAEPIQMLLRKHGVNDAYEQLKTLTRGNALNAESFAQFIDQCQLPEDEKNKLRSLTPADYIGIAHQLALENDS
jgi:adenylosuccinate lyase